MCEDTAGHLRGEDTLIRQRDWQPVSEQIDREEREMHALQKDRDTFETLLLSTSALFGLIKTNEMLLNYSKTILCKHTRVYSASEYRLMHQAPKMVIYIVKKYVFVKIDSTSVFFPVTYALYSKPSEAIWCIIQEKDKNKS